MTALEYMRGGKTAEQSRPGFGSRMWKSWGSPAGVARGVLGLGAAGVLSLGALKAKRMYENRRDRTKQEVQQSSDAARAIL